MKILLFISAFSFPLSAFAEPPPPARPFGSGTITRTPDGATIITTRYGRGTRTTITRTGAAQCSLVTTRYGHGTRTVITSPGKPSQTLITSPYGYQKPAIRSSAQSPISRSTTAARAATQASRTAANISPKSPARTR